MEVDRPKSIPEVLTYLRQAWKEYSIIKEKAKDHRFQHLDDLVEFYAEDDKTSK
mgnify:CR=1 FL=1